MASQAPVAEPVAAEPPAAEPPAAPAPIDFSQLEADVAGVFGFDDSAAPIAEPAAAEAQPGADGLDGSFPSAPVTPPAPAEPSPAAPQPATPVAPAVTPPAPVQPPAPVAQPPVDDPVLRQASLEAQVQALQSTIEQLRASPPQPAAQPAQPGTPSVDGSDPLDKPPAYNLSLPESVQTALSSDDPQQTVAAVGWVANAVATIVHHNLRQEFKPQFERLVNGMIAEASQSVAERDQATTVEAARAQYYEKFTDHKNPLIQPIVAAEAQKLASQYPGLTWGNEFMDSLGARVNAAVASLRGEAAPVTPQAPTPPVRPAPMLPAAGPRPMVPIGGKEGEDLIFETLADGAFF